MSEEDKPSRLRYLAGSNPEIPSSNVPRTIKDAQSAEERFDLAKLEAMYGIDNHSSRFAPPVVIHVEDPVGRARQPKVRKFFIEPRYEQRENFRSKGKNKRAG